MRFKVGMNNAHGYHDNQTYVQNPLSYRFNNGQPNQLTMRALPHTQKNHVDRDLGIYAQDKWTVHRATISLGIRFDNFANTFPEQELGPMHFTPSTQPHLPGNEESELQGHDAEERSSRTTCSATARRH